MCNAGVPTVQPQSHVTVPSHPRGQRLDHSPWNLSPSPRTGVRAPPYALGHEKASRAAPIPACVSQSRLEGRLVSPAARQPRKEAVDGASTLHAREPQERKGLEAVLGTEYNRPVVDQRRPYPTCMTHSMDNDRESEDRMHEHTKSKPDSSTLKLNIAILAIIGSSHRPLTAYEVHRRARSEIPAVDYRTVHDTISELVRDESLRMITRTGRLAMYALVEQSAAPKELQQESSHGPVRSRSRSFEYTTSLDYHVLTTPSREVHLDQIKAIDEMLGVIRDRKIPHLSCVVFPPGLDRTILSTLPLKVRSRNCLISAGLCEGSDPQTVGDLLSIPNFGRTSLEDVLLVLKSFLKEKFSALPSRQTGSGQPEECTITESLDSDACWEEFKGWTDLTDVLRPLLASAVEFDGATTLTDILSARVLELASLMRIIEKVDAVAITDLVRPTERLSSIISRRSHQVYDSFKPIERVILESRILASKRKTLSDVASGLGVTKERVRQIQVRIEQRIERLLGDELEATARVLNVELGPIVPEQDVDRRIGMLFLDNVSSAGSIARYALKRRMWFERVVNGICLNDAAVNVVEEVKAALAKTADDVGLVDEERVRLAVAGDIWRDRWSLILDCCGFHRVFGAFAVRDTVRARVKAAVRAAGEPITRKSVAERCGVTVASAGTVLANIPSLVRADKTRWGLAEWIDDEYEGIANEIVQRIDEDGGVTSVQRLLAELPGRFGVSPLSVQAYLKTAKFVVADGHVSVADVSSIGLRYLDDVIDGRDEMGAPYWTFEVHERHLCGYSVSGLPPELAHFAGCGPESALSIGVAAPAGCGMVSIRWRLASIAGATIGYLAEPLRRIGAKPADRVRITVTDTKAIEVALESRTRRALVPSAHAMVQRMKDRRKVI